MANESFKWIAIAVVAWLIFGNGGFGQTQQAVNDVTPPSAATGQCNVIPTYTYSAFDPLNGNSFTPTTTYIKSDGKYPVTSLANPPAGASLEFLASNSTYNCDTAKVLKADCSAQILQGNCYKMANATLSTYDTVNRVAIQDNGIGTGSNITIGANGQSNMEVTYVGTSKKPMMALGGCIAVEYPTTITEATLTGAGISAGCAYPWTYTVSSTSNTYKLFSLVDGYDKAAQGDSKVWTMTFKAGSSDPAGTAYVKMVPIGYYTGNDGVFYKGIEKDKNADSTKTVDSSIATTFTIIVK